MNIKKRDFYNIESFVCDAYDLGNAYAFVAVLYDGRRIVIGKGRLTGMKKNNILSKRDTEILDCIQKIRHK